MTKAYGNWKKNRDFLTARDILAYPDGSDCAPQFNQYLIDAETDKIPLHLDYAPGGFYQTDSPLVFKRNGVIMGGGQTQAWVIKPNNCVLATFDGTGVTGGRAFLCGMRGLWVDCSLIVDPIDYLIYWNNQYRCFLVDLRVALANNSRVSEMDETPVIAAGLLTEGVQSMNWLRDVSFTGAQTIDDEDGPEGPEPPITQPKRGSGFMFRHIIGNLLLDNCDAEVWQFGYNISASVHLSHCRGERNSNSIRLVGATEDLGIPMVVKISEGGYSMASAGAVGFHAVGPFNYPTMVKLDSVEFSSNSHETKNQAILLTGDWNIADRMVIDNTWQDWFLADPELAAAAHITPVNPFVTSPYTVQPVYRIKKTDVVPGAVNLFELSGFDSIVPHGPVTVRVEAWATRSGYSLALETSMFVLANRTDLNVHVATKQAVTPPAGALMEQVGSANFEFTGFAVTAVPAADTVTFIATLAFDTGVDVNLDELYVKVTVEGDCVYTAL